MKFLEVLLTDADRCMDLYESGADRSEIRLSIAKIQIQVLYEKGANIDKQLLRLINLYRRY